MLKIFNNFIIYNFFFDLKNILHIFELAKTNKIYGTRNLHKD